jgi:hypothetical protein
MTPFDLLMQAAAYSGMAQNQALPAAERLLLALKSIALYEAYIEETTAG